MKCHFCGTDNPAGETFCTSCGGHLNGSPPPVGGSSHPIAPHTGGTGSYATTTGGGVSGTLAPSARLQHGRYMVEKILGQGGMGAAVLARDTRVSNKAVVIKELLSDSSDPVQRQEDVRNFELEVKMLAELDHPLIPSVTDSFQESSRYYMVQEYVPGENLEKRIERENKPLLEQEVLTYASQVLDILDYLSQQQPPIVHRDIKPANIIVSSRNKRAHLVDFGIARADVAKHVQRKQTTGLGTPGYAPPEQYQGNADTRSDLYALAATMHHLLTNRDPREYPPFAFPPIRSLNAQLSPDIEQVLGHALAININQRYQNAAAMKRDIDEILIRRFHTPADTSGYLINSTMSGVIAPSQGATMSATTYRQGPLTPLPPTGYPPQGARPQQQIGASPIPPPPKPAGNNVLRNFILLIVVIALIAGVFVFVPRFTRSGSNGIATQTAPTPASPQPVGNGIAVTSINGEPIGISDGSFAFDTRRGSGQFKQQAAEQVKAGNGSGAIPLWKAALSRESNDAEALIYLENQRVLTSGRPYITLVVATMLTGNGELIAVGRDMLQGVYVAQKEFNDQSNAATGNTQVRLLVANIGSKTANTKTIAQQIVTAAQNGENKIVGVVGWPYSSQALSAIEILSQAKIPSVSPSASSNALTGTSSYFFRVAPSDTSQAMVGAKYAQETLKAKNVAVFEDSSDAYSQSLASSFKDQFAGGSVFSESYKRGDRQSISNALEHALSQIPAPDLIYFAGYSSDVSTILTQLPSDAKFANLKVLGGDALYNLGGYPSEARANFNRLRFTAFAYPDMWEAAGLTAKKPTFYTDYGKAFDPNNKQVNKYGFSRPAPRVVLSYDAALALLTGSERILESNQKQFTPENLQDALTKITGTQAIQGASGQIAFGSDGDPVDKAVLILAVSPEGFIQMVDKVAAGKMVAGT